MNKREFLSLCASAAIAVPVSALTAKHEQAPQTPAPSSGSRHGKESAYDRVIRTGVLRAGVMLWPPYFDKDLNTGQFKGLGADLFGAVASLLDVKLEMIEITVGQQVEELNRGRVDVVLNDGPYVFSSIKFCNFGAPAYFAPGYIYVRQNEARFKAANALDRPDITFVGMDGDISLDLARLHYPRAKLMALPATTDLASLLLTVTTGKADAVITDPLSAKGFNAQNRAGLRALDADGPEAVYPIGMSTRKGEESLMNVLNSGINAAWNVNAAEPILHKYDPTGTAFLPVAKPYEVRA